MLRPAPSPLFLAALQPNCVKTGRERARERGRDKVKMFSLHIRNRLYLDKSRGKGRSEETHNCRQTRLREVTRRWQLVDWTQKTLKDFFFQNKSTECLAAPIRSGRLHVIADSTLVNRVFSNQIIPTAKTLAEVSWWEMIFVLPLRPSSVCPHGFDEGKIHREKAE